MQDAGSVARSAPQRGALRRLRQSGRRRRSSLLMAVVLLLAASIFPSVGGVSGVQAQGIVCEDLAGMTIPAEEIGLPTTGATVQQAVAVEATGSLPPYCRVEGIISPVDPTAPNIRFRVNLPVEWNGSAMHFGGGGYNGTVVSGTGAAPGAPPGTPVPLARGFATFGSDSGHEGGNASFALNEEAMVNFGYAALKKTRDVAVTIITAHYGRGPAYTYFVGSSQGGREAVTVAQRFPEDYDGVLSIVPVLSFTGLQIAGNRMGAPLINGGWMNSAKISLLANAVRALCDGRDGLVDGLVAKYADCEDFDPAVLRCPDGTDAGDHCLSDAQIAAVRTLRSPLEFDFPLANGVTAYPAWTIGNEDMPGGWPQWVMGSAPPPAVQNPGPNPGGPGIVNYGAQFVRFFIAQDPAFQTYDFDHNDPRWRERIEHVSAIVDATDPDLSAFHARGGKLILVEYLGDHGRNPWAGIQYYESVVETLGKGQTDKFMRLYVSPGADHGGNNGPSRVDWVSVLTDWVEHGKAPGEDLVMVQSQGDTVVRTMPACLYPNWPRYMKGDPTDAASFTCTKAPGFRGYGAGKGSN